MNNNVNFKFKKKYVILIYYFYKFMSCLVFILLNNFFFDYSFQLVHVILKSVNNNYLQKKVTFVNGIHYNNKVYHHRNHYTQCIVQIKYVLMTLYFFFIHYKYDGIFLEK